MCFSVRRKREPPLSRGSPPSPAPPCSFPKHVSAPQRGTSEAPLTPSARHTPPPRLPPYAPPQNPAAMASCRVQGTRLYTRRQTPALRRQPFMAGSFRNKERQPPALRENVRHCRPDRPRASDSLRKNPASGTQELLRLSDGSPAPFVRCFSDAKAAGAYGTADGALRLSTMEREVSRSVPARPGRNRQTPRFHTRRTPVRLAPGPDLPKHTFSEGGWGDRGEGGKPF